MGKELDLEKEKLRTLIICEYRYNHNHGPNGRFTFSKGGGGLSWAKKVGENAEKVQGRLSNNYSPFQKEAVDMEKVKDRGGMTDAEAKQAVKQAEKVFEEAASKEPTITNDVVSSVQEAGGQMDGLDYRLKQPTSMAGKIGADAKLHGTTYAVEAASIKDSVRYTAVMSENNFTQGYQNIKASMEAKGYTEVRCKNFYEMYSKGTADQKAVQCVYADKSGFRFEFQFHTAASLGAKELNHPLYEQQRKAKTPDKIKKQLSTVMKNIGSSVANPVGVMNIKSHDNT